MRLAIVASVVWMVAGTSYFAMREMSDWQARTSGMQEICLKLTGNMPVDQQPRMYADCEADARRSSSAMIQARGGMLQGSAGFSFVLMVIAWLAFAIVYGASRWILAGRKNIR